MNYTDKINDYLKKSGGIISASYCKNAKIPTIYLSRLVKEGKLIKVVNGLYITENADYDEFFFFQYRYKKAIFSYETALFLLGMTDKIPDTIDVTVYQNYKFNNKPNGLNIHYVKKNIYNLGITEIKTIYGNIVKTYSYERILCDFISHKDEMNKEDYIKLIRSYSKYENKNIHKLYEIAIEMNIVETVKSIMEVTYE